MTEIITTQVMITDDDVATIWLMHQVVCENEHYTMKYFKSEFEDGSGSAIDRRNLHSFLVYENSICIGEL